MSNYDQQTIVVGIRPEDFEDAALAPTHPEDQQLTVTVSGREALGAETLIHFPLNAPSIDTGDPDALDELASIASGRCTARFDANSKARIGEQIRTNVTVENMHFFDRETGLVI